MATQIIHKVLALPAVLEPHAQYQVKEGDKLVIYVIDQHGNVANRTVNELDLQAVQDAAALDATAKANAAKVYADGLISNLHTLAGSPNIEPFMIQ